MARRTKGQSGAVTGESDRLDPAARLRSLSLPAPRRGRGAAEGSDSEPAVELSPRIGPGKSDDLRPFLRAAAAARRLAQRLFELFDPLEQLRELREDRVNPPRPAGGHG